MEQQISPEELVILSTIFALLLANGKSADELNVLGNLVVATGSLLLVYAAQAQSISAQQEFQSVQKA